MLNDRVRFKGVEFKSVDAWVGIYLGDQVSYLSGIWRKVYVCPVPMLCCKFEVFQPKHYLGPSGVIKSDKLRLTLFPS